MANHAQQNGLIKKAAPHDHDSQVVVVVVPFPAQGHLNQLLHLSRLISAYGLPVHYVGSTTHNRQAKARVAGWNHHHLSAQKIHFHDFKLPPFQSPPPNPNSPIKFPNHLQPLFEASHSLRHPVAGLLRILSLKSRRIIVVNDSMMASVVQDVAYIPNAESYTFRSVSAFAVLWYILESKGEPFQFIKAGMAQDLPSLEGCFTLEFIDFMASQYEFIKLSSGSLYNTCRLVEGSYLDLIANQTLGGCGSNKHWAIGPFNPVTIYDNKDDDFSKKKRHKCLEWLDKQAENSVIFVSFGTTTAFTDEQIKEIATGLEQSKQKFIWVLRDADKGNEFENDEMVSKAKILKRYEERVKEMGIVVQDWAPQLEILGHSSTGGFMSHCGWNSCMESITMGVPIATWPIHSDQPRNAFLITKVLKLGVVVKEWEQRDEIVTAAAIEKAVRRLMALEEGDEMRKRAAELGGKVQRSMDKGGVSRIELDSFIAHIRR